ncbi:MAG: PD40 domain-containing protein [Candidatus Sabulitectum sp.]|nr:PD40 domain-containing protein [Candidatus Sabulitectum sp.]
MISKASLVFVCLFLLSGCAEDTSGPSDPYDLWYEQQNESIVFLSKAHSPEGELYLLDKSGEITRLTFNSRHENNPAISSDGTRIAFQAGDQYDMSTWEIYLLDIGSGNETRLTNNSFIEAHPDWGPGDSLLVFSSWHDSTGVPTGAADIFTMRTDGSQVTRLTDSPWEDNDAEWSPDGAYIAFKSNRITQIAAREEIFVMDADGFNQTRLTTTFGWQSDHDPSWSPDSKTITYSHYNGSRQWFDISDPDIFADSWDELIPWNIFSVDLLGNSEQLTDVPYVAALPVFEDDGSSILFLRMDFIFNQSGELIGADHPLILIPESGGTGEQLIPDNEHTGTLEYHDW